MKWVKRTNVYSNWSDCEVLTLCTVVSGQIHFKRRSPLLGELWETMAFNKQWFRVWNWNCICIDRNAFCNAFSLISCRPRSPPKIKKSEHVNLDYLDNDLFLYWRKRASLLITINSKEDFFRDTSYSSYLFQDRKGLAYLVVKRNHLETPSPLGDNSDKVICERPLTNSDTRYH